MTNCFDGFENCYGQPDIRSVVNMSVSRNQRGKYFDAFHMPVQTLSALSDELDVSEFELNAPPIGTIAVIEQAFPAFRDFQSNAPRAFVASGNITDTYETIIRREKANREHARILSRLASVLRLKGYAVSENTFVDLFTTADGQQFIFEVKSNNARNTLSQIRKAIAQLYEYRYRSVSPGAILCIVLHTKPPREWVIDYLLNDRQILVCWLVDDVRLECPGDCRHTLATIGLVN
jgi:Holliday junction resolvase